MVDDIRWKQRFESFDRAFVLLREVCDAGIASLNQLEKEGAARRLKVAFELGWKTMRDYLQEGGIVISPVTPRNVIKEAFSAKLLPDAQVWIDMMLHRNLLSHTYDFKVVEDVLAAVESNYLNALDALHERFLLERADG
ncbi:MAG: nucleotidyltransferase substrate binding protein [Candidatus Hydrogenedentes bacterium]|nr:nucleotidyltransferase substrate binding protein [Candidatus Hydrogenedentota bacterium]